MLVILTLSRIYVRVVNRQPTQKLGANSRDDGPLVSIFCSEICYSVYFFAKAVDIFLHHLPAFISYSFLLYISFWPWTFLCSQLTDYLKEGPNKISLSRNDSRTFCLGIRIAKRRSLEQVGFLVYSPLLSTALSRFKTHIFYWARICESAVLHVRLLRKWIGIGKHFQMAFIVLRHVQCFLIY